MFCTKMFHSKMTKLTFIKEKLFSKFEVQIVLNQIPWFLIYFSGFKYKGFEEPSPNKDLFRDYLRILLKNCKYQKDWNSVKKYCIFFSHWNFVSLPDDIHLVFLKQKLYGRIVLYKILFCYQIRLQKFSELEKLCSVSKAHSYWLSRM